MGDRNDGPGMILDTAGRRIFSDGDPKLSPPNGSVPTAKFMNGLQESVLRIAERRGFVLDPDNNDQVYDAILDMIADGNSRRRKLYAGIKTGATSLDVLGHTAPTILGTAASDPNGRGPWLKLTTATPLTVPEDIGVFGPYDALQRRWNFDLTFSFDTQAVNGCRLWFGVFSASPMALSDPASISCAGWRYEHGVDGSVFKTCTSNGTTSTIKATNVAMLPTTSYRLRVRSLAGGIIEFLDDTGFVTRHDGSTTGPDSIPAAATNLGPVCALRHVANDSNSKDFRFGFWAG